MKEIKKYTIITTIYYSALIKSVNEKIEKGWQPYGNLNTVNNPKKNNMGSETSQIEYTQAMVIYIENDNKQILND